MDRMERTVSPSKVHWESRFVEAIAGGKDIRGISFIQKGIDDIQEAGHAVLRVISN